MKKKILFITWDGPQTSYMEGLFMPIFNAIQEKSNFEFHVIQFTWGTEDRISITKNKTIELNIKYTAQPIIRKPIATIGSFISLYKVQLIMKEIASKLEILCSNQEKRRDFGDSCYKKAIKNYTEEIYVEKVKFLSLYHKL